MTGSTLGKNAGSYCASVPSPSVKTTAIDILIIKGPEEMNKLNAWHPAIVSSVPVSDRGHLKAKVRRTTLERKVVLIHH